MKIKTILFGILAAMTCAAMMSCSNVSQNNEPADIAAAVPAFNTQSTQLFEDMQSLGNDAVVSPQPVFILGTYDENGVADAMNAAWGMQIGSRSVAVMLSPHKTTDNLRKSGCFTLALATVGTEVISDYVGIVSANDVPDKAKRAGLQDVKGKQVNAPIFRNFPLTMECRVREFKDLGDDNVLLIGDVVATYADKSILGVDGKVDLEKMQLLVFDGSHLSYRVIGPEVGKAFGDGKKI